MAFCVNCGTQLPENVDFCTNCGAKQSAPADQAAPAYAPISQAPSYDQPAYQAPSYGYQPPVNEQPPAYSYQPPVNEQPPAYSYQPPVYSYQQPVSHVQTSVPVGAKIMGFIGMGLGITALIWGILAFFGGIVGLDEYELAALGVIYGLVGIGFGIPAKILSSKASSQGFAGAPVKVGSIMGLIGIILGGVGFFFGFIGSML